MEAAIKEQLIRAFLLSTPHVLEFEYRKREFKRWRLAVAELLIEGRITLINKNYKTITFALKEAK